jgi:UDP-N-acetyl-2-amino-2-deoxyglucuronate dehydrogenase
MTARYRAAIIGCGDIGHAHAEGYLANPEVELRAVVDPVEPARRQFQAEYGVPEAYGSAEEMFAACRPDLVSVCVWHPLHAPMTIAAAEAGASAVICEKPMARSMAEVDAMIEACDRAGAKLLVSHQRRFTPGWERARELVAAGAIGEVHTAHGRGIDGLLNVGTHIIDGLLFIIGEPDARWVMGAVQRETDRYERDTPIEDRCMLLVELDGGAQLFVQNDLPTERDLVRPVGHGIALHITGSAGMIEASEYFARTFTADSRGWRLDFASDDVDTMGGRANARQVRELIRWLEGGGPEHRCSARRGRRTMEIMMAAYESARRNRVVHLPLEESSYPLQAMIEEGRLVPTVAGAYDIRGYLRREGLDEERYAELRATGMDHHEIMAKIAGVRGRR